MLHVIISPCPGLLWSVMVDLVCVALLLPLWYLAIVFIVLHLFSLIVTARVEVSKSILPLVMNDDNGVFGY